MEDLLSALDFTNGAELNKAVSGVFDPDKTLMAASAKKHVHLLQTKDSKLEITGYCTGDVWIKKTCTCAGLEGVEYLVDGEDLLNRLKGDVWKKSPLRISQTPSNVINIRCITPTGTSGNIEVSSYGGDLEDFKVPEIEWEFIGTIYDVFNFRNGASLANDFSGLNGDTANRSVWFHISKDSITIMATEKGGDRGIGFFKYTVNSTFNEEHSFGIQGKHLMKIPSLINDLEDYIGVYIDKEKNRIMFKTKHNYINLPIHKKYKAQALSKGGPGYFWNIGFSTEIKTVRDFRVQELRDGVDIQTPKKGANRNDIILEFENDTLLISKRSDIRRRELSKVPTFSSKGLSETWINCTVDHSYFSDALTTMTKYCLIKQRTEVYEEEFYNLEAEEINTEDTVLSIEIRLKYCAQYKSWFLSIVPNNSNKNPEIEIILLVQLKEMTSDYNESD